MTRVRFLHQPGWFQLTQRILLAVFAGYWLSAGVAAFLAAGLAGTMPLSEAVMIMTMMVFLIYLAVLIWAFTERRLPRLWLVLGGGSLAIWVAVLGLRIALGAS